MHECPICGQTCDCDGEDTWFSYPYNLDCTCNCEEERDADEDDLMPDDDDLEDWSLSASSVSPTPREPATPIRKASSEAIYHECGNCGVPRFEHGGILEACPNCGDDETDLSLIDEAP